jgi:hypothetical protein
MRRTAGRLGQVLALIGAAAILVVSATEVFAASGSNVDDCQPCSSTDACAQCCINMGVGHQGGFCTVDNVCFCT